VDAGEFAPDMCAVRGIKQLTNESVEALQNLLLLIREDAGNAHRVQAYVDLAEKVLSAMHTSIVVATPC
jgi:hypothetical protein